MKRFTSLFSIIFSSLLLSIPVAAFPITTPGIDSTRTAILIYDLMFDRPVLNINPDLPLIPASVMKAVTSASVLNLADAGERFFTPVIADGPIEGNVLNGNLVIRTSGDPTIESEHFAETSCFADSIACSLAGIGVTEITGSVVVDESEFVHTGTPAGWMKEDLTWPYGTDLHGANFRDNKFILRMPSKSTEPHVPGLVIKHINPKSKARSVKRQDGSATVTVSGRIPTRGWSDRLSTPDPAAVMRHEIMMKLKDTGISVNDKPTAHTGTSTLIYTHISPAFGDILQSLMHRSDNLMAEGMLRALRPGGSRSEAIEEEMKIWTDRNIYPTGVSIEDGSGLSRNDRLTASFLGQVLREMLSPEFGTDFTSIFPLAGRDGTMRNTFTDTRLEGRAALKTGSMKGVRSFAGYIFDNNGYPTHIVVIMANGLRCSGASFKHGVEEMLLEYLPKDL